MHLYACVSEVFFCWCRHAYGSTALQVMVFSCNTNYSAPVSLATGSGEKQAESSWFLKKLNKIETCPSLFPFPFAFLSSQIVIKIESERNFSNPEWEKMKKFFFLSGLVDNGPGWLIRRKWNSWGKTFLRNDVVSLENENIICFQHHHRTKRQEKRKLDILFTSYDASTI